MFGSPFRSVDCVLVGQPQELVWHVDLLRDLPGRFEVDR